MTMPRLASSRWWYIMPIVFVTYSLAYLGACRDKGEIHSFGL